MKKRLFTVSLFAIGALALASCGNASNSNSVKVNPAYENETTKGNSVDSVTFNKMDNQGEVKQVTISKDDKYADVCDKLARTVFNVENNNVDFHPYVETFNMEDVRESTNYYCNKMVQDSDGYCHQEDELTYGDIKNSYNVSATSTVYKQCNDEKFYLGDSVYNYNTDYNLASGNVSLSDKKEELNVGQYIKYSGSTVTEGSVEYASNRKNDCFDKFSGFSFSDDSTTSDFKSIYYKTDWADSESYLDRNRLKAENKDIYFNVDSLFKNEVRTQVSECYTSNYYGNLYVIDIMTGDLGFVPEKYQKYYELSFELTDKYIIIKNKINTSSYALQEIIEMGMDDSQAEALLKKFDGSYTYKEIWIDYKEKVVDSECASLGYAYGKIDYVSDDKASGIWNKDENYYLIDSKSLEDLGLIGKTWTQEKKTEYHYEAYIVDIDDNTINTKKTEFINNCKKDNFLDKYNFTNVVKN